MPDALTILHVLRAPLGGLLRHVADLARGQSARGHRVGVIADATISGAQGERLLEELGRTIALGVARTPMARQIGLRDFSATRFVGRRLRETDAHVLHGHGAKGAAYARLADPAHPAIRVCTPHGGSLHYRPGTPAGILYLTLEKILNRRTDLFLFESEFAARQFRQAVGEPRGLVRIARNGLAERDFDAIVPADEATDLVFVGELRSIKGVDLLLDAVAALDRGGLAVTATLVGSGPDEAAFRRQAERLGIERLVQWTGPLPAREAFRMGRIAVVPSRSESLPYIVLECIAAGMPLIATAAGGIPEIFGPQSDRLVAPGDGGALARAIAGAVKNPQTIRAGIPALRAHVRSEFSVERMVELGLAAYREAMAATGRISH